MSNKILTTIVLLFSLMIYGQDGPVLRVVNETIGTSQGMYVSYFKDDLREYDTIFDILRLDEDAFVSCDDPIPDFNFSSGRIWFRFDIENKSDFERFVLETGRPITNRVEFYEFQDDSLLQQFISGDDFSYGLKPIENRKILFPIHLKKDEVKTIYLKMESDGELLFTPFIVYDKMSFFAKDFKDQFKNGFYYGLIALVVIIYFFFFVFLREKAFLYYVLYAFSQGMLQFSLDGYSHHHLFFEGGYLANHILLVFAGLTVVFLLIYVNNYLQLKERHRVIYRIFYIVRYVMIGITLMSLIPGYPYEISFPIINLASLLGVLLATFTIIFMKVKGFKVDNYFAAAFIILIAGGVVFILGNVSIVGDKMFSLGALKVSSALEFVVLSISMSNKYGELQREKEEAQELALKNLQEKNQLMDEVNTRLEEQVKQRTEKIELQNRDLEKSKNEILSSIKYAKRIQMAILPPEDQIKTIAPELFVYYSPKDVVSGDFYFVERTLTSGKGPEGYAIIAAVDCTGHGVPGAFMSIVGNNLLKQTLGEKTVNSPAEALNYLNQGVINDLQRKNVDGDTIRDGMDIAMCAIKNDYSGLLFSGAKNPLYFIRKKSTLRERPLPEEAVLKEETDDIALFEIRGDRISIGSSLIEDPKDGYTNHVIALEPDDKFFVFSDGYADQFGGPDGKKFRYKRFRELLIENYDLSVEEEKKALAKAFNEWCGETEQIDDVLVMGMRIPGRK